MAALRNVFWLQAIIAGLAAFTLSGCALWNASDEPPSAQEAFASEAEQDMLALRAEPFPYKTEIVVEGVEKDEAEDIRSAFERVSQLVQMRNEPPDGRLGLERRIVADRENADGLLRSLGYYDGHADTETDWEASPAVVHVVLTPGVRFTVGSATVETRLREGVKLPEDAQRILERAPSDLKRFGLRDGSPADASAITAAVDKVAEWYSNRGFPFAAVRRARYRLYPSRRELNPLVQVSTGPFARFGELHIEGTENVSPEYLKRIIPWREGRVWRAGRLDAYREMLQQSGLFRDVNVRPDVRAFFPGLSAREAVEAGRTEEKQGAGSTGAPPASSPSGAGAPAANTGGDVSGQASSAVPGSGTSDSGSAGTEAAGKRRPRFRLPDSFENDRLPVLLTVREASPRRTGLGASYDTELGPGVKGYWEHRNLFGEAERLRLTGEVMQDRQEITSSFTKPAFLRNNQNLVSNAYLRNEKTDTYDLTGGYADIGLERKLSWRWWGSVRLSGQAGRLREDDEDWKPYSILGVPVTLRREGTDSLLNPTRGTRLQLSAAPYTGRYRKPFSLVRMQADFSAYYAPFLDEDGRRSDKLVLAGRVAAGGMAGSMGRDVERIPGSLRFYAGGGGSVRGYKYQSLGPRNNKGDPLGGLSFTTFNAELRWRVTENIGIVPFVDAGAIYDKPVPDFGRDLYWSAGLGLRYHTAVGPVRLDFAFPLKDHDNQKTFQMYISIGQAF